MVEVLVSGRSGGRVRIAEAQSVARFAIVAGLDEHLVASLAEAGHSERAISLSERDAVLLLATIRGARLAAGCPSPLEHALRAALGFMN